MGERDVLSRTEIYTVSEVLQNPDVAQRSVWCHRIPMPIEWLDLSLGNTWLRLAEIPQQPLYFRSIAFRPLRPTNIEVFKKLLEPEPARETA